MAEVRKGAVGRRMACAEAWVKRVGYVEDLGLMLRVMGSLCGMGTGELCQLLEQGRSGI